MKELLVAVSRLVTVALVCALGSSATAQAQGTGVTTIAAFAPPLLPESVAADAAGALYTASFVTGDLVKIAPDGTRSTLAKLNPGEGNVFGVAAPGDGSVLIVVGSQNAPGADTNGVWRVRPDGTKQLAAAIPPGGAVNDVLPRPGGGFYVSDSGLGAIYRVTPNGTVEKWAEHDLLKPNQQACPQGFPLPVGVNGMTFAPDGSLLVTNTNAATIVRVPVNPNAGAGTPTVWAGPDCERLLGADGPTADGRGGVYVAVNLLNTVVQVAQGGTVRTVATAADGLDFPSSVKRGSGRYAGSLVVANFAALAATTPGGTPHPALLAIGPSRLGGPPVGLPRTGAPGGATPLPWVGLMLGGVVAGAAAALANRPRVTPGGPSR